MQYVSWGWGEGGGVNPRSGRDSADWSQLELGWIGWESYAVGITISRLLTADS